MFEKILVLCSGNICRSPLAEHILKKTLPAKHITSAGLLVEKSKLDGRNIDEAAKTVANNHGLQINTHFAKQVTLDLSRQYDLILVMEKEQLDMLYQIDPLARGKSLLFSHWVGNKDIPDPYKKSGEMFEHVWDLLTISAASWANKI